MFALPAILQLQQEFIDPSQLRYCRFHKTPVFPVYAIPSNPALIDPYWPNNTLYITGIGTNGSSSIIDSSITPKVLTPTGTVFYTNQLAKYNNSCVDLSATGANYLTASYVDTINTFTLEMWIYFMANSNNFGGNILSNVSNFTLNKTADNSLNVNILGNTTLTNFKIPLQKWNHIAITRVGTTRRVFFNGRLVSTVTVATSNITFNNNLRIGGSNTRFLISNLRLTKNVDRYQSYFNSESSTNMVELTNDTTSINYYNF